MGECIFFFYSLKYFFTRSHKIRKYPKVISFKLLKKQSLKLNNNFNNYLIFNIYVRNSYRLFSIIPLKPLSFKGLTKISLLLTFSPLTSILFLALLAKAPLLK